MALPDRDNSTKYTHPQETNILNAHKAMQYDGQGRPILRTTSVPSSLSASSTAFGENISVPITPIVQLDALYGLDPQEFETFNALGGTAESTGLLFKCSTGTSGYGYGVVRSRRLIRYRPGQGALVRFTAAFENPQAGVSLRAGMISQEQSIAIGYNGTRFGVLRANGGKAHIAKLTVTGTGNGTATITLNGVNFSVPITNGSTTEAAVEIASFSFAGWITEQQDNTVFFLSNTLGPKSGAFAMAGTGSGTFTTSQAGVDQTEHWTYQEDFELDKLNGTGVSGITMDPSKLNVFTIDFRWLGVGEIRFAMENPNTGDIFFFHFEHFSNRNTSPHLDNPSFKIGYAAYNTTSGTITNSYVTGASMMAAIEGLTELNAFPTATGSVESGNLTANDLHHVMSIKNSRIHRDKINLRLQTFLRLSLSFEGNDPAQVYLILDGGLSVPHEFARITEWSSTLVCNEVGTFDVTVGKPLAVYALSSNGAGTFDMESLRLTLPPNAVLSVAIRSGQAMAGVRGALTWLET